VRGGPGATGIGLLQHWGGCRHLSLSPRMPARGPRASALVSRSPPSCPLPPTPPPVRAAPTTPVSSSPSATPPPRPSPCPPFEGPPPPRAPRARGRAAGALAGPRPPPFEWSDPGRFCRPRVLQTARTGPRAPPAVQPSAAASDARRDETRRVHVNDPRTPRPGNPPAAAPRRSKGGARAPARRPLQSRAPPRRAPTAARARRAPQHGAPP
jgi:hypothetical protein